MVTATTISAHAQLETRVMPFTDTTLKTTNNAVVETKPLLNVSGSADVYYRYDFAKQKNNYTSFTNSNNSFALGMASVKLEYSTPKTGVVIDLGYGPRQEEFAYNDNRLLQAVKQFYVDYKPTEKLTFTAGTWATHVGYELLDPQLNRNYSMSYLFSYGPFSHTGLKASYSDNKSGFMLGVANATDFRKIPTDLINRKFALAQYSFSPTNDIHLYFNYVGGKNPDTSVVNQLDFTGSAKMTDKFSVGLNASINSVKAWDGSVKKNIKADKWWGIATYLNEDFKEWFGLTLRSELFNDKENRLGFNTSIFANTLSANFKIDGLIIIPELRIEAAGKQIYTGSDGLLNKKNAASFLMAAVYSFK